MMMKNAAMLIAVLALACACSNSPPPAHNPAPVIDAKSLYGVDELYSVPAEAYRTAVERGSIPEAARPAIAGALSNAKGLLDEVVAAHAANNPVKFFAKVTELSSASFRINQMIAEAELPGQ